MKHTLRQTQHSNTARKNQIHGDDIPANTPEHGFLTSLAAHPVKDARNTLVLTLDGEVIGEYEIEDHDLIIGRHYDSDIKVNDYAISSRHAVITSIPDYVFIEDLGSTNGTLVNGRHIKKAALEHGDIIQVGHHQLTYLSNNQTTHEPTMFLNAEDDETQFIYSGDGDEIIKGLQLAALYYSQWDNHSSIPVLELRKTVNTIGFKGNRMALISRGEEGYSIKAIQGQHNRRLSDIPLLNGEAITNHQEILNPGDVITIAGYDMNFDLVN